MSVEKLFTDKGVAIAEAELRKFANMTPPVCIHERGTRKPPYCKPFEQFQECALVVLDLADRRKTEIERLEKCYSLATEERDANVKGFIETLKTAKSKARRDFAEALKGILREYSDATFTIATVLREINDLLKEMERDGQ